MLRPSLVFDKPNLFALERRPFVAGFYIGEKL